MAIRHDQPPNDEERACSHRSNKPGTDRGRRQSYPDLTDYIRKLVDEAPPLDEEQRARLGRILRAHLSKQRARLQPPRDAAA